jgi:hypothetical protein
MVIEERGSYGGELCMSQGALNLELLAAFDYFIRILTTKNGDSVIQMADNYPGVDKRLIGV